MNPKVMKQIRGGAGWIQVSGAIQMHVQEMGTEPETLWELLAFVQAHCPGDQRLIRAVHERAVKYEPRLRSRA
jgi:hypothetical protein